MYMYLLGMCMVKFFITTEKSIATGDAKTQELTETIISAKNFHNVECDDLYQKIVQKLNHNLFFSLRSISINTVHHIPSSE